MGKECKRTQELLIDIFYQEKKMDADVGIHLQKCEECRLYLESLHKLKNDFSVLETKIDFEIREEVRKAFQTADNRAKKRKELADFMIFFLVILVLMSFVVTGAVRGYGMIVITIQLTFAVLTPLIVPLLFVRKFGREDVL